MDRRNSLWIPKLLRGGCAALALLLAVPALSEADLFHRKRRERTRGDAPAQVLGIVIEPLADGLRLQIDCSSRVRFRWGTLDAPRAFYVDLEGAQIARTLRQISVGAGGVSEIRSDVRGTDQVRITLGLAEGVRPDVDRSEDGRSISIRIQSPDREPGPPTPMPPAAQEQAQRLPRPPEPEPTVAPPPVSGPRVTGLTVENLSASEAVLHIQVEGQRPTWRPIRVGNPPRLVVELPGTQHAIAQPARFAGAGPLTLGSVWSGQFSQDPPVTRVVVRLPRPSTPFTIEPWDGSGELRVRIGSPATSTARPAMPTLAPPIRGRFEVGLDPGHGGSDPGALNPSLGICEKTITLDIARRLARLLDQSGIRIAMTRSDDRRLDHAERITFVSRGSSDAFVSIHCDAIEGRPQWTGITTYYHGSSGSGRELAAAIQSCLPAATGLPDRGIRSDTTRFQHGFYVLRTARMPAVLIECGYVSHAPTARKMMRPEFREQVAQGIAQGLRKYWADHRPRPVSASLPK